MILLLAACFISVLGLVAGIGYWFLTSPAKAEPKAKVVDEPSVFYEAPKPVTDEANLLRDIGRHWAPKRSARQETERKLRTAGFRNPRAIETLQGIKMLSAALAALGVAAAAGFNGHDVRGMVIAAICAGGFVSMLPERLLEYRARSRAFAIRRGLPPALDLIVLGLEAGQTLDQSLSEASRELRDAYPELSSELAVVPLELRAGYPRAQVLTNLARRNEEPELTKLVNLLADADRFGTSLAPALRTHARYMRTRRRQLAQEQARKTTVKLVFPVFFLIFPSVLVVTLGPAVISLYSSLIPMLAK
ncbi:MAG: type II secretion system F family protein [Bryobacteraceae bacterium]|nr:type II secretion system F family protein [Bryobacteraceae bacterium]